MSFLMIREFLAGICAARAKVALSTSSLTGPHQYPTSIQDFSVFRNSLFIRGSVEHGEGEVPTFYLRRSSEEIIPLRSLPDRVHQSNRTRTCFSLIHPFLEPVKPGDIQSWALIVRFRSEHLIITHPGAEQLAADRFATSEGEFWQAVRSHPGSRVLEIGSRARSGISRRDLFPSSATYTGFDITAGPNVDVVGDAHQLSRHFPANHFDFAFSVSVWEHLAMPWKVSLELNRIMKIGGLVMINTHQSWPSHEEPWDYFRFSEYSWASLFNPATGFQIVAVGHGSPAVMAPALPQPHLLEQNIEWHYGFLASRVVAKKISETTLSWPVETSLVSEGLYPH